MPPDISELGADDEAMHLGAVLVELRLLSHFSHTPAFSGAGSATNIDSSRCGPLDHATEPPGPSQSSQRRFPLHDAKVSADVSLETERATVDMDGE